MIINGFTLANDDKLNRAIYGSVGREGKMKGGVGEKAAEEEILAEYDRLGGLILKGENKVKTGSFYDFDEKLARKEPKVVFETSIDGMLVEVSEDEVVALKTAESKVANLKSKKVKKIK